MNNYGNGNYFISIGEPGDFKAKKERIYLKEGFYA